MSRETIRLWYNKFGAKFARRLRKKNQGFGDTFCLDEVFVKINGKQHYLWRAVDQDGEVVDVYLQLKRDGAAARCFFNRLLTSHGSEPRKIVTDKLRSYGVAHRELIPEAIHDTSQYANNRAELSHRKLPRRSAEPQHSLSHDLSRWGVRHPSPRPTPVRSRSAIGHRLWHETGQQKYAVREH